MHRHFTGHGCFSSDGTLLFTAENDYAAGAGRIGIWDAQKNYRRVGDFASGGIGPHEILRLPGSDVKAIANGGIQTHPDTGRAKLNLETMMPNLSYVDASGTVVEQIELPKALHRNSIRHLAAREDGLVAFAMQWEGDLMQSPPLLGLHTRGSAPRMLDAGKSQPRMRGYAGSVAMSGDGAHVGITSPRGGVTQVFRVANGRLAHAIMQPDVCGLAAHEDGFLATDGTGGCRVLPIAGVLRKSTPKALAWDNHLGALT